MTKEKGQITHWTEQLYALGDWRIRKRESKREIIFKLKTAPIWRMKVPLKLGKLNQKWPIEKEALSFQEWIGNEIEKKNKVNG